MTVLVGILCSDGVVIGSDSAFASGVIPGHFTMEQQDKALKIELIGTDAITATTGFVGLAHRFNEQISVLFPALKEKFYIGEMLQRTPHLCTPIQQSLLGQVKQDDIPFNKLSTVGLARIISQVVIADFQKTKSALQNVPATGWGLGALLAFVKDDVPQLVEFDPLQFHPEVKGLPDPKRGDRVYRAVSMGAMTSMSDPFLAHAYRVLFGERIPTVDRAKLVVAWTIDHVTKYNFGTVGGKLQLAVLEKTKDTWTAHHSDPGEIEQQVEGLEKYITEYRHKQQPDAAAEASQVNIDEELKP